jgi:integrase/recombinase XerD
MLSPKLLDSLRAYWRKARPQQRLFPGDLPGQSLSTTAVEFVCRQVRERSGRSDGGSRYTARHGRSISSRRTAHFP